MFRVPVLVIWTENEKARPSVEVWRAVSEQLLRTRYLLMTSTLPRPARLPRCDDEAAGTVRGYQRHRRGDGHACQACLDAHNDYSVARVMQLDPTRLREYAAGLHARAIRFEHLADEREALVSE